MSIINLCSNQHRSNRNWLKLVCLLVLLCAICTTLVRAKIDFNLDSESYFRIEIAYGKEASKKVAAWRELINELQSEELDEKLYEINRFFNRFDFVDDLVHWQQKDYWATPIEFIATGAGDCEDYTIATVTDAGDRAQRSRHLCHLEGSRSWVPFRRHDLEVLLT